MPSIREDLVELGRSIVEEEHDPEVATGLLSRYAELFTQWHEKEGPGVAMQNTADLESLQKVHDAVLEFAVLLRDRTEQSIKGLRHRGKTILSYVDTLPKRVSMNKPKKG